MRKRRIQLKTAKRHKDGGLEGAKTMKKTHIPHTKVSNVTGIGASERQSRGKIHNPHAKVPSVTGIGPLTC